MRVGDLMTRDVRTCRPTSSLAAAATTMWDGDCGVLPVVDDDGRAIAVITDRDICMAAAFRGRALDDLLVGEVAKAPHGEIWTCRPDDSVEDAMTLMGRRRVRRLPVVAEGGGLLGILSITDVIRASWRRGGAPGGVECDIVNTLGMIARAKWPLNVEDGWEPGLPE